MSPPSSTETRKLKAELLEFSACTSASGGISAYILLGELGTASSGGSIRDHGGSPAMLPSRPASTHEKAVMGCE
jgi:hypothetical protein